jgi:peptide/nickel transport system permease protein
VAKTTIPSTPTEPDEEKQRDALQIPESENQWKLVWREFRRRRIAVAAYYLIVILLTISIFAPFLANDRPLVYRGVNHRQYREASRNIGAVIGGQLRAIAAGRKSEFRDPGKIVAQQIDLMAVQLPTEKVTQLKQLRDRIVKLLGSQKNDPQLSADLRAIRTELRREFDVRKVKLVIAMHWPVLTMLHWIGVILLVLNTIFLLRPAWNWLLGRLLFNTTRRTQSLTQLAILVGLPLLAGLSWKTMVTHRVDVTPYKQAIFQTGESLSRDTAVVYDWAIWPVVPYGLDEINLNAKYLKPGISSAGDVERQATGSLRPWQKPHWLGTDGIGRDITSRMIWGGRVSMAVGIVAVSIYVTIGVIVGSLAGYFRGICDLLISRIIEVVICFPSFFLILTIVAFVGPSIFYIMLAIGFTAWTGVARLVRGEFLRLGQQEFVLAGRALGYSPLRIIFRHVLPNALAPVLVSATFGIAGAILTESALSFLGFGVTVPWPSWGSILSSGRDAISRAPWLIYFPGIAIFLTITAYNLVGEALRDASDPRLRGQHTSH